MWRSAEDTKPHATKANSGGRKLAFKIRPTLMQKCDVFLLLLPAVGMRSTR